MEKKTAEIIQDAEGFRIEETTHVPGMIYQLIGQAIGKIGAIGKDKKNPQQGFMYRGIDQVYNALNPVLAELGIFFVPEVLDMRREERTTKSGTVLTYTILTMKYTAFAPDGSCVCMTVVGEGMDSGDKGCNKAMSVAMKYAMFQLFCIPTEEMKNTDPDAESYQDVMPRNAHDQPKNAAPAATVTTQAKVPSPAPKAAEPAEKQETPNDYMKRRIAEFQAKIPKFNFLAARAALINGGVVQDIPSATMTMEQAVQLMNAIEANCGKAS